MSTKHHLVVPTCGIDSAGSDFEFDLRPEWVEAHLPADADVSAGGERGTFRIHVTPVSAGFWIEGRATLELRTTCLRCLRPTVIDLDLPFKVHMTPGPPSSTHDEDSMGEDGSLGVGHYQGDEIVLDNLLRESIVLALPMSPRCAEECSIEDLYREEED
jgi:uncharacterized metal-binding protein YceD (DUF177 family)